MANTGSEFAETAALLAVMNEDDERLTELLDGMLPGELDTLARQCDSLALLCRLQIRTNPRTGQERVMMAAKVHCSRCDSTDSASPLPKRFRCRTCGDRPFCYACDITHNNWCGKEGN